MTPSPGQSTPDADSGGEAAATQPDHASRRVWVLIGLLTVVALIASTPLTWRFSPADLPLALGIMVLFAVTERWVLSIRLADRTLSLSLSEIPLTVGVLLLNPAALVLARLAGVAPALLIARRQTPVKAAFNSVFMWVETLGAVAIMVAINPTLSLLGYRAAAGAILMALGVAVIGAGMVAAATSAHEGRLRVDLVPSIFLQSIGPITATTALAVMTLALAEASLWLLWAPAVAVGVLLLAYQSHVRLLHLHDRQSVLLRFTRLSTGRDGVDEAAQQVVDAASRLAGVTAAGILDRSSPHPRWHTGWVDISRTGSILGSLSGTADDQAATIRLDHGDHRLLAWELGTKDWLLVAELDRSTPRLDDLERTLEQIATHASVAIANASHAEALQTQATDAARRALRDPLTGLPNRAALLEGIKDALDSGEPFATLLMDLDDFKEINDALGHAAGDEVLQEVGRRLAPLRDDALMLARIGGDEFAALVCGGEATGRLFASRLLDIVRHPVQVPPYTLEVGGSVGIALHPEHAGDADALLRYADLAMYEAKGSGVDVSVFGAAAAGQAVRHLAISTSFRGALADGELYVDYQPQIDLHTGAVIGVEALARWDHPDLGAVAPDEFIRVAEQSGLLHRLTDMVLADALSWQRRWASEGLDLQVAVNLSARSLLDTGLPSMLATALDTHHVPADKLTIEITEGSVISDPPRTIAVLGRVSQLGVRLAIDDFGTGYSSLAYLQQLPVDEVKVDKSLVTPIADSASATPLISGVIRLCHEMGFTVIAEGIESATVQSVLRRLGCDAAQGFHIARPMAPEQITGWALTQEAPDDLSSLRLPE